jgi:hypothetical protein
MSRLFRDVNDFRRCFYGQFCIARFLLESLENQSKLEMQRRPSCLLDLYPVSASLRYGQQALRESKKNKLSLRHKLKLRLPITAEDVPEIFNAQLTASTIKIIRAIFDRMAPD